MVDRSRVGRVQNVGFATTWKGNVNVTFGDFSTRGSVSVNTHGTKMDNVGIDFGVNDSAAKIVGTPDVVVDRVTLGLGILHGVRGGTLFSKVDNGIRLFFLDKLDQQIIFLGHIQIDEFHFFSRDFLPCLDSDLRRLNGSQRIATKFRVNVASAQVIDNDDVMPSITQVKRSGPSTETISTQHNNLLAATIGFSEQSCRGRGRLGLGSHKGGDRGRQGVKGNQYAQLHHLARYIS
mmetsp:Transcript_25953/g.54135  ORF Transcript_25953/g.54135 Transcript_25953/m.54135 type:complete len:235 (+) Transcript_25953:950-1654(+)